MVRHRLPSSSYYTPVGESEWSRETLCERPIAVLPGAYRNPIEMARHVAEHVRTPQPFFVMDVAAVQRRLDALRIVCPRLNASFSVALNADPVLARIIANNEASFEVSNTEEMQMASLHVEPSRITLLSNMLTRKSIRSAADADVGTIVVESEKQLQDVMKYAPRAEILIAINLRSTEVPFGVNLEDVNGLIEIGELIGVNVVGVHIDMGPQAGNEDYSVALQTAADIFEAAQERRVEMHRVSLGDLVFAGNAMTEEFIRFASGLNRMINDVFPIGVQVSANVGRFIVTNAFTLCTTVIGKQTIGGEDGVGFVYQTNDGVYGSFGCRQMNIDPSCQPLHPSTLDEPEHFGTVVGPTLDQLDIAQKQIRFRQLRVGDWLVWEKMGAFTIPVDSDYTAPPVYYYSAKECWKKLSVKEERRRSPTPDEDLGSDCDGYASSSESESEGLVDNLF
ncbi:unnamed protein product [Caenorhabditis bovis]|uniref:Orn/DAP/Arg decarboxylase 2 N-terminal domain-containing protein n=1 Tax=Caenorhabditis bovis TaxID=2654633 RepID=A0A8S1F5V6_9PELO|nr:unnamed protein product [Caenorhabditis bovis]